MIENHCQCLFSCFGYVDDLEMSHKSWGERCSAATGRSSCTNNSKSFYFLPGEGLSVIEPILIDKLAKKLDWGLGTPNLLQRHVDIVNKYKKLGVASYSPNPLSLFLKLSLNFGLCALAIGLGRKVELY